MSKRDFKGIDFFRFISAILIVAIHTSPLMSYSQTGDFIFTRIIARVAVPFFLMTSGYFLISKYTYNADKLKAFVKKTGYIYAISILIYIPINLYNSYFSMEHLLPNIIKDIVFDGTMYHLWYLPASIVGAIIAWYLVKHCGMNKAMMITMVLYVIGLLGDSYYGITANIPVLNDIYAAIFQVTDHTRNGLFFAPVFLVLGGILASKKNTISLKKSGIGFGISFVLMFGEAMLLNHYQLQRHDSMYVFLIPTMFFLFQMLLLWRGNRSVWLRDTSLIIYIIHPMMIVCTRLFAKIVGLEAIFIENSIMHYLAVSAESIVFAFVVVFLYQKVKPAKKNLYGKSDRAWIEVNLDHLKHNVDALNEAMPENCELMAVVKAEAYGHGSFEVATYLDDMGVKAFAVATIDEGIHLRKYGVTGSILILGYTSPYRAKEIKRYGLTQTIIDYAYAEKLNEQGIKVKAHIKVDTGMHRLGIPDCDVKNIENVFGMKYIDVCGVYTHLCCSDSLKPEDVEFTKGQLEKFSCVIKKLREDGFSVGKVHTQSSSGLLNYPELDYDYIRAGIALYGVRSSVNDDIKIAIDLRPVLALKSRVVLTRAIAKGECVGYSRVFTAERDSIIAILPLGYCDGIPRELSNGVGSVEIHGKNAPIIGRICMDQLIVDVTDIEGVSVGDIATLVAEEEESPLSAPMVADKFESISNELLSRMGTRLNVVKK